MSFAVASTVLALVGLVLLAWGLRVRRVGGEPHCRTCEYNLTGVVSRHNSGAVHPPLLSEQGHAATDVEPARTERGHALPDRQSPGVPEPSPPTPLPRGEVGSPLLTEQRHTDSASEPLRTEQRHADGSSGSADFLPAAPLCPECGTAVSHGTVRWGEKRRRVLLPLAGVLLLLTGAAGVYANFDRNRWMRSYPYPAVVMFAKGGDRDALLELHRRYKNVELSDSATRSLIEEALDVQRMDPAPANLADWLALLDNFDTGRSFTAAQRDRYVEQVFHNVKLEPRTVYREGERLMASLEFDLRYGGKVCMAYVARKFAFGTLASTKYDEFDRFAPVLSFHRSDCQTVKFPTIAATAGEGFVDYELMLQVSDIAADNIERTVSLRSPLHVVPFGSQEPPTIAHDAAVAERLAAAIEVKPGYSAHELAGGATVEHELRLEFRILQPFAASLVSDVLIRHNGGAFQGGTLAAWKGTKVIDARMDREKLSQLASGEITLVLRHNASVVHQMAGLEEVYVPDLVLGPLQIEWPLGWGPGSSPESGDQLSNP